MESTPMRTILITGGFGFIGSHLVEALLTEPDVRVHVVDSLITSPIDINAYLKRLDYPDRLTWDICSVKQYFSCKALPVYDEVYHLASVVGPVGVLQHAGRILQTAV